MHLKDQLPSPTGQFIAFSSPAAPLPKKKVSLRAITKRVAADGMTFHLLTFYPAP